MEPPHAFSYRWARPSHQTVREDNSTLVEFTLTPEGEQTRLRVVESGFRGLAITAEEQAKYAAGNTGGWKSELDELVAYVAGVAV